MITGAIMNLSETETPTSETLESLASSIADCDVSAVIEQSENGDNSAHFVRSAQLVVQYLIHSRAFERASAAAANNSNDKYINECELCGKKFINDEKLNSHQQRRHDTGDGNQNIDCVRWRHAVSRQLESVRNKIDFQNRIESITSSKTLDVMTNIKDLIESNTTCEIEHENLKKKLDIVIDKLNRIQDDISKQAQETNIENPPPIENQESKLSQ